ncbi:MAG TPA: DUF1016 N-terminal domain-containing protein [Burkholderiaceae bacterium]|nr:DUF1016 N-terminal domain-containing protein [Burkholderiaceae bacterium]
MTAMPKEKSAPVSADVVTNSPLPVDYERWLATVKQRIAQTQTRAAIAANREMVLLYWELGRDILTRQEHQGWGAKVVDRLAHDLRSAFPEMTGFSVRNLKYMRAFAVAWPDAEFVQQVAAQIPWGHNQVLLDRIQEPNERRWYRPTGHSDHTHPYELDAHRNQPAHRRGLRQLPVVPSQDRDALRRREAYRGR